MADMVLPGPVEGSDICQCQKINIHTMKISDACKDKDCIEDIRVYPTVASQAVIDSAFSVRPCGAELIYADVKVDEISFNRGYYTVDISYFYKISGEVFPGGSKICGLAVFEKRVILFGSEGDVKTFTSARNNRFFGGHSPTAIVEAVDPIILNMRISEGGCEHGENELRNIPDFIRDAIGEDIALYDTFKKLYVTLGQFSMIRLERDTQITLDDFSYFVPEKECVCSNEDDPCTLFSRVEFPTEEFYPPDTISPNECYRHLK
ncbi:MAG: hypothetical protein E7420_04265 [Ruminococcaceae bacterium]|nr:hypothetical protein [Oscillospiraceae bacterium]